VGLCSIRGSVLGGPFAIYSGHILYFNMDAVVLANRAWAFLDQFTLPVAIIPVPEPNLLQLQAMALLVLLGLRRRRMASPL
jgi:hypothetical protein